MRASRERLQAAELTGISSRQTRRTAPFFRQPAVIGRVVPPSQYSSAVLLASRRSSRHPAEPDYVLLGRLNLLCRRGNQVDLDFLHTKTWMFCCESQNTRLFTCA